MAGSSGPVAVGPAGLTLKAWALFNGTTGAIIAGAGLTFNTHPTLGVTTLTIAGGLVSAITSCVVKAQAVNGVGGLPAAIVAANVTSTTAMQVSTSSNAVQADISAVHVEVWAP